MILIDPTGHYPIKPQRCFWGTPTNRANFAKMYVSNKDSSGNLIMDEINTYTAAGIGVQCFGTDIKDPRRIGDWDNSGEGPAQITDNERKTPYGERIGTRETPRGWGLLCWIKKNAGLDAGCECLTEDEMSNKYGEDFRNEFELEKTRDQHEPTWAGIFMRRRIDLVVGKCKNCSAVDKFIIAGLAQNGPGFNVDTMTDVINPNYNPTGRDIDWIQWYENGVESPKSRKEYPHQLRIFHSVILKLKADNYYLPADLNLYDPEILYLMNR